MDRGEGFKEVCAYFGAAMYFAQVLEHGIANALLFLDFFPNRRGKWTEEEYERFYDKNFDKTLGNLIKSLKRVSQLSSKLEPSLQEAKDRRSFLAHHFFRERERKIRQGLYGELIEELEEHRAFFNSTDRMLEEFIDPIRQKYGVTKEDIKKAVDDYLHRGN